MNSKEVRDKYLKYFRSQGHIEISPAPLVLENDPTTLFTSSGMQPLVPYLMGEPHEKGKRLVNSQPSIRLQDIEEVGNNRHTTFFEMLGNWSLGDYFKEEQLSFVFDFLTKELELSKDKLWVSVFEGNDQVPKDSESISVWKKLGIPEDRIVAYSVKKNWWSRSGTPDVMPVGEIGGPDSEIFYDFGENLGLHEKSEWKNEKCHPNCDCGRFMEIGNSVFMQYKKVADNKLEELPNKNVDFGGGLERMTAATENTPDVFKIDTLFPLVSIEGFVGLRYGADKKTDVQLRIIADHIRASCFLIKGGVVPSNKLQGYVLRRFIRRIATKFRQLDVSPNKYLALVHSLSSTLVGLYENSGYFDFKNSHDEIWIADTILEEMNKFESTLSKGLREVEKIGSIDAQKAFNLYQSYGFPLEITKDIFENKGQKIDLEEYRKEFEKHQELSRTTSAGVFKGGLADQSPEVVKLHTATHLLLASLRKVLGEHVVQKGQNITKERSRFDFPNPEKLTEDQIKEVGDMVNKVISQKLSVNFEVMPKSEALETGAIHGFNEKYADTVKVYFVGESLKSSFSREFCGGPHVANTSEIGRVKIRKQEKIGSGVIRIYMELG